MKKILFVSVPMLLSFLVLSCGPPNFMKKVGVYNYNDVVDKLGKPESTDLLENGNFISRWKSDPLYVTVSVLGSGGEPYDSYYEWRWSIMTFNPDSLLIEVKYEKEQSDTMY